ncbi:MAG: hypothetical protein Q8L15_18530 [Methylobacter sp.]|nr:hypothetical protein [Methylobacter sp.]
MSNIPAIPSIPSDIDPQLAMLLIAIKANLDYLQASTTTIDVSSINQTQLAATVTDIVATTLTAVDLSAPPAIDGLTVVGGALGNLITWGALPGNVDHIDIYRAATNDRTVASVVGTSKINYYQDYIPAGVGTNYYYWIQAISKEGATGMWNTVGGQVSSSGTSAIPLGIGDSQVSVISATKIYALSLAALTATLGDVTAGTLKSGDRRFVVNLVDKEIIIASDAADPDNAWNGGNYIKIKNGSVETYAWNGSVHVFSKSLQAIEVGVASNGSTVSLTKFYPTQPKITVSPNTVQCYSAANTAVDQTLQFSATNIQETTPGSGAWTFTATAQLVLASGTNVVSPNWSSGVSSSSPLQTPTYTSPANTTDISVNIDLTSFRGTGTAPDYYNRTVTYGIYARTGADAFALKGSRTVGIGSVLTAVNDTLSAAMGAAGAWDFYVTAAYSDAGGTFAYGSGGYNYAADITVSLAADTGLFSFTGSTGQSPVSCTLPSFTPTSGYSVYQVDYTISYGRYWQSSGAGTVFLTDSINGGAIDFASRYSTIGTLNVPSATGSIAYTQSSYATAHSPLSMVIESDTSSLIQAKIFAAGTHAVVKQRQPITNSTTASNTLKLISYNNTISGATTLASGTLNWMAIL